MKTPSFQPAAVLAVCLWAATYPAGAGAQESKPTPPPVDRDQIDLHVYDYLRDVINRGAAMYNNNDANGCYQLFRSALVSSWYMLDHHPRLREDIKAALDRADAQNAASDRAVTLRGGLDAVRAGLSATAKRVASKAPDKTAPDKGPPRPAESTLWERLGKEEKVRKVVDEFVAIAGADAKVDFTRGGKYQLTPEKVAELKTGLVQLISENTGGPLRYTGLSLKRTHRGMGITDAEFDASVRDLGTALERNGVRPADAEALLKIVETTRAQIVEPKATPEKKSADTKPVDAKPQAAGGKGDVTGIVTLNGKPLANAVVQFVPKDKSVMRSYRAVTDAKGKYAVKGAPEGDYVVVINAPGEKIPGKVKDAETSSLTVQIKKGDNMFDVALP